MLSAGPIATAGTSAVTLIQCGDLETFRQLSIINEGAAPGFVSFDGGNTWLRLPAGPSSRTFNGVEISAANGAVLIKRDGGTDMSAVYADGYQ